MEPQSLPNTNDANRVDSGPFVRRLWAGVVWQPVNIPGGRKKWIDVRSKSWVTEIEGGCHVGYRGEYLGVENKTAEECMSEIGAMLDHFHASSPNDKTQPRAGRTAPDVEHT